MRVNASAPWHRESYDRFIDEKFPEVLASRIPLGSYHVQPDGEYAIKINVAVSADDTEVSAEYPIIPRPDREGIFEIGGKRLVVVPKASSEELDTAEISCVGEQLYDYVAQRLGEAPPDLQWDESMIKTWLPLDKWMSEFLQTAQVLDETNWLSRTTHLRRIVIKDPQKAVTPGQFGRTCPFEIPEGPNIMRVRSVANGAEIHDGKLVIRDDSPEASLGVTALMVPFLEHSDANRLLMGVNMMRQWQTPSKHEPALVQTGYEPDEEKFWCGMNLLTAFVSWGPDTFEDGVVISESAAKRFRFEHPVEPGDKISNRHGTKGVISRILPDDEMPHLPDGTPVELVFSFLGCHTRLNFGQIREALMGRVARVEGKPAVVPPFAAPDEKTLRDKLGKAGIPDSGMVSLTAGQEGQALKSKSTVGWVYWGRTAHNVAGKIHASAGTLGRLNVQGEREYLALREAGAFENIIETFNTRSSLRHDAETLTERVASGPVAQASAPTPKFTELARRLRAGGVEMQFDGEKIAFRLAPPEGQTIRLAFPVPHPWLRGRELAEIGLLEDIPAHVPLAEANTKATRLIDSNAPENLKAAARNQLAECVNKYFDDLVRSEDVYFSAGGPQFHYPGEIRELTSARKPHWVLFSGRSVIAPGANLHMDQVGLPDKMAWELFAPLLRRETDKDEVEARTDLARKALDSLMARSWLIVNRAPTVMPTAVLAFHPVRIPDRVIRIHPLVCLAMNADFDGDQSAVFLPITDAAQREAGEKLSVAGHLRRDPELLRLFCPTQDVVWGLAACSLTPEGYERISSIVGAPVDASEGFVTRSTLISAVHGVLHRDGVDKTIEVLEKLMRLGLDITKSSGASIDPFLGETLELPIEPEDDDPEAWDRFAEEVRDHIASLRDFQNENHGAQLLAVKSGARGSLASLARLLAAWGVLRDTEGKPAIIRNSFTTGLEPDEMYTHVVPAREALWRVTADIAEAIRTGYGAKEATRSSGFGVIARAMRGKRPGAILTRAAERHELDPLTDIDSRLFVGLLPLDTKEP
jgi:hypothetical protein